MRLHVLFYNILFKSYDYENGIYVKNYTVVRIFDIERASTQYWGGQLLGGGRRASGSVRSARPLDDACVRWRASARAAACVGGCTG